LATVGGGVKIRFSKNIAMAPDLVVQSPYQGLHFRVHWLVTNRVKVP
jgi:hypothetical protein